MEAQKGWKKILWAVNVLAEDKELENKVGECLTSITKGSNIIEPV